MPLLARFWNQSFFIPKPTLTEKNLPDQSGRVFIVTGGYAGCGYQLAKILYQRNGVVYLAGRNKDKADKAIKNLQAAHPSSKGRVEFLKVDLADLTTIKPAVEEFTQKESRLDVLTNNAAVMVPPAGSLSAQKHELQVATNVLGPFLLTKLLTPLLEKTAALPDTAPGSVRVTWAGSLGVEVLSPKGGVILDHESNYISHPKNNQKVKYGATKAANVLLAAEFGRRHPRRAGEGVTSNAWNPGNLQTELQRHATWYEMLFVNWMLYPAVFGAYTELFAGWSKEAGREEKNGAVWKLFAILFVQNEEKATTLSLCHIWAKPPAFMDQLTAVFSSSIFGSPKETAQRFEQDCSPNSRLLD
ncbi:short-chain alcohol dehydrogenase [Vermiconidia calcicola]|uniref:Short-chain alcohol dehydrogenase n=1 Tax=Vermiconidia calcicola TaxID=1690605 RepID=A0ACC3NC61_9PEZI|nr:short-chain alcohol dehydrogenase [Vermiconidia calcicola]